MPPTPTTPEKLLSSLAKGPGATAAELAQVAGIGRSTANKTLAVLEAEGRVSRTGRAPEGGRRQPDRWSLVAASTNRGRRTSESARRTGSGHRLGKGELRAMVLAHLQAQHDEAVTPTAVAASLGRSAGAVSNALIKLTVEGAAVQVGDQPRRFAISR
jgi:DNA-binding IclR family transcriptional regulator